MNNFTQTLVKIEKEICVIDVNTIRDKLDDLERALMSDNATEQEVES